MKITVWYLLLNNEIKIVFMPVGVADVVTSGTSPWIPVVNSCKQTNEPANFKLVTRKKKTSIALINYISH